MLTWNDHENAVQILVYLELGTGTIGMDAVIAVETYVVASAVGVDVAVVAEAPDSESLTEMET